MGRDQVMQAGNEDAGVDERCYLSVSVSAAFHVRCVCRKVPGGSAFWIAMVSRFNGWL